MFVVGGESLIDLVSEPRKAGGLIRMSAHAGGSPYNCAIALARLGNETGFLCPISQDGFGAYLLEPLEAAGANVLLSARVNVPSTLAVVTLNARGQANYEFYRGAERALDADRLHEALPSPLDFYQIGGFCPIEAEDAEIWFGVVEAALQRGALISFDPNLRPSLVPDFEGYKKRLSMFLDLAHLIKLSVEDLELLDAEMDVATHARALLERPNCQMVVVTDGENGSRAFTKNHQAEAGIYRPAVFGDTVGAGDSLMAGIVSFLADQKSLTRDGLGGMDPAMLAKMLQFGAVVAGLNCAQKGCKPPTRSEVDTVLDEISRQ